VCATQNEKNMASDASATIGGGASTATCYLAKLKGHKKAVNCLDVSFHEEHLLASGSDDRSARIWDTRTNKSVRCVLGCFSGSVESICFDRFEDRKIYCSSGRDLYAFDLRCERVMLSAPSQSWPGIATDDVSSIKSSGATSQLAFSDDNGALTVFSPNAPTSSPLKQFPDTHKSILSSLSYRPPAYDEIVSGGFDCRVSIWNAFEERTRVSANLSDPSALLGKTGNEAPQQFFNPAFVHGVDYICNGELIACALGDGSVRILSASDCETVAVELEAHNGMASSLFGAGNAFVSAGTRNWSFENLQHILTN
jgi:WD40 repeat protein